MFYSNSHLKVEQIIDNNFTVFNFIEKIIFDAHGIPINITRDNIKQKLLAELNGERKKRITGCVNNFFYDLSTFMAVFIFLIICTLFLRKKSQESVDILFDYWTSKADEFYMPISEELYSNNIGILINDYCSGSKMVQESFDDPKYIFLYKKLFSAQVSWSIVKTHYALFGKYRVFSKSANLNIVSLVLSLVKEIATHLTFTESVKAKILVSAHDNGYSPYRYHIYHSNGIENILLIQNGGRVNIRAFYNSYIYADYYIGWSKKRFDDFIEMHCDNKLALGSMRLNRLINKLPKGRIEYDILFMEQICDGPESNGTVKKASILDGLKNLKRLANECKELKIAYCCRPGRETKPGKIVSAIDKVIDNSRIIKHITKPFESYDLINKSLLIVSFDSSTRCEALIMNKFVVTCNYTKYQYDFIVKYSDDKFVIQSNLYAEFKDKLLYIIDHQDSYEIQSMHNKMKLSMQAEPVSDISYELSRYINKHIMNHI